MYLFCFVRFLVDIWKIYYLKLNCLIHLSKTISKNPSKTFLFIILGHIISFKNHFKNIYWFFQNKSHSETYFNLYNALNNNKINWDTPINYFFCRTLTMNQHDIRKHTTQFLLWNLCLVWISSTYSHKVFLKHQMKQENASIAQSFRGPIPKRMALGKTWARTYNLTQKSWHLLDSGLFGRWKQNETEFLKK